MSKKRQKQHFLTIERRAIISQATKRLGRYELKLSFGRNFF